MMTKPSRAALDALLAESTIKILRSQKQVDFEATDAAIALYDSLTVAWGVAITAAASYLPKLHGRPAVAL